MKTLKNSIVLLLTLGLIISCSDSGGDSGEPNNNENPDPVVNVPAKPVAILPANGETCADYNSIGSDDSKAGIDFSWNKVTDAKTYILKVAKSETLVVNKELAGTSNYVILDKGETYNWTVTAKNSAGESISITNSFTTPGEPIGNYVPYAAVINFDINTDNDMASLSWVGNDQNDAVEDLTFNILVTEDDIELISLEDTTQTSVSDFNVIFNSTYKIEIKTTDASGSTSISVFNYTYQ